MPILHLYDSDGERFWGHLELPALPRPGDLLAVGRHGAVPRLLHVDAVYPCADGGRRRPPEEAIVQVTPQPQPRPRRARAPGGGGRVSGA
jgi:hypothetical protein